MKPLFLLLIATFLLLVLANKESVPYELLAGYMRYLSDPAPYTQGLKNFIASGFDDDAGKFVSYATYVTSNNDATDRQLINRRNKLAGAFAGDFNLDNLDDSIAKSKVVCVRLDARNINVGKTLTDTNSYTKYVKLLSNAGDYKDRVRTCLVQARIERINDDKMYGFHEYVRSRTNVPFSELSHDERITLAQQYDNGPDGNAKRHVHVINSLENTIAACG